MLRSIYVCFLLALTTTVFAQDKYWQQHVSYKMDVKLDDKVNTISGKEEVVYTNNSPETLDFIWFHIWPNAYKNDSTALFQQLMNDSTSEEDLSNITRGYIDGLNFKVDGKTAKTEPHSNPNYIDIIKVLLPKSLKPGASATISTDFNVKLPSYFSRSGFADGQFMATQWYPKPAVYDKSGWHEFPYLSMGEYYSEYGDYKVNITLPGEYVVGATGVLQNKDELEQYKTIGSKNATNRTGTPELYKGKSGSKTLSYTAENVPDFAWFAEKNVVIQYDTLQLSSDKIVDAFTYYKNKPGTIWNNSIDYAKDGTRAYSKWIGDYQYPTVQVFEGPKNNSSGGMEYPMITLITVPDASKEYLDGVIAHEIGHNWFMSMLGSNEREHTWQDEGLNTYFQFRYEAEKYRYNSIFKDQVPEALKNLPVSQFQATLYNAMRQIPMTSVIDQPAANFKTSQEYGLISYIKTAMWVYQLEQQSGQEKIDAAFKEYFKEWSNKHPQPEDMKAAFEKSLGTNLDSAFNKLKVEGSL
ncbi:M1 family metallopeptidase [Niabella ginsengisoli]|uniref:M1 family metallopeptidase n=1 Tax=Niabella ginsengisoli TaxID=522298 RepID=A0ABS9SF15_9BACT|nr:M1 family metallopeptidase [Niabella ginsengisoli]MCH5596951.1 M1 family metallopeptidase [Niabella ginsengisoli]